MCTHDFQGRKLCDVCLSSSSDYNQMEQKKKNKINATNMKEITKGGRGKGKKLKENKEKNVPWLKSA